MSIYQTETYYIYKNELDLSSEQRHVIRELLTPFAENGNVELSDHEILVDCYLDKGDAESLNDDIDDIIAGIPYSLDGLKGYR